MPRDQTSPGISTTKSSLESSKVKDGWDKADVVGKLLGSIMIPLGLAALGYFANSSLQDKARKENEFTTAAAAKLKKQELAMTILLSGADVPQLRQWAASVFTDTTGIPIGAAKELEHTPLSNEVKKQTVHFVAESEGCSLKPYLIGQRKYAIGCGHVDGVDVNTPPITQEQAEQFLADDLKKQIML